MIYINSNNESDFKKVECGINIIEDLDVALLIERIKNDVNGNPRFQLKAYEHGIILNSEPFKILGSGAMFSKNKQTVTFQSYNLKESIKNMVENYKKKLNS